MPETPTPAEERWLQSRVGHWQTLSEDLQRLGDKKPINGAELRRAVRQYPEAARDLAVARRIAPTSRMTAYLESIYNSLYRALHQPPKSSREDMARLFREDIPSIAYELRWQIGSVTAGFVLATVVGWLLISSFPDLMSLVASRPMIDKVQAGELWTDGLLNIMPSSILSVQIFTNNILVALTTMSLGILFGLGTIYIIGLNGFMIGGIFAFCAQYNLADRLFNFVAAHGFVELSVIAVAGAIGFSLGESIARPGHRTRGDAFQYAAQRGAKLMLLCVLFLVGAGLIEGYVSPNPNFSLTARLVIGIGYWLLFAYALCGWRIPRPRTTRPRQTRPRLNA